MPTVSIITASYNYAQYITETIESVLNQTFQDWEMIIIDDGSKDNSIEIIQDYCSKDNRIKLYTHKNFENKGLIATLKLGLNLAKGKYVVFLESDDYISEDYLERKLDIFKQNPNVKLVCNNIEPIGEIEFAPHKYLKVIEKFWSNKKSSENIHNIMFLFNPIPTFSCVMLEKSVLNNCNYNTPKASWIDWWLWTQISKKTKIQNINNKLTFWRIHQKSYIKREEKNTNNYKTTVFFYEELYKLIDKKMSIYYKVKVEFKRFFRIIKYKKQINSKGSNKLCII